MAGVAFTALGHTALSHTMRSVPFAGQAWRHSVGWGGPLCFRDVAMFYKWEARRSVTFKELCMVCAVACCLGWA